MKDFSNPVIRALGRRLRLGLVGGGPDSFIGRAHRTAARIDGLYEIVAGCVSSDPQRSKSASAELGIPVERCYGTVEQMLQGESRRSDPMDAVAIMTPNDSHPGYSIAAMNAGFHVICDKPMANSLEDAAKVYRTARETGRIFALTHNYSGYPMVRQARAMVADGAIGELRLAQVEYVHGGSADEGIPDNPEGPRGWKFLSEKSGPSPVLGDIGSHAYHLLRFVGGRAVREVKSELGSIVPGRRVHDYAGILLRIEGGAGGMIWLTRSAAGIENGLKFRLSGNHGTLEWNQEVPHRLDYRPIKGPAEQRTQGGPGSCGESLRVIRYRAGHPEGFLEAFGNIYSDAADSIAAHIAGQPTDHPAKRFSDAEDGLAVMRFIDACIRSNRNAGRWTEIEAIQ